MLHLRPLYKRLSGSDGYAKREEISDIVSMLRSRVLIHSFQKVNKERLMFHSPQILTKPDGFSEQSMQV